MRRKPHRVKKRKAIVKKRLFFPCFLFILLFLLFSYFLFFSGFFNVDNVFVSGDQKVSREKVVELVERELGKKILFFPRYNIFLTSLSKVKKNILDTFPQIEEVSITRKIPDTLDLNIIEREEVALFCGEVSFLNQEDESPPCFLLDKKGIIFEPGFTDSQLPLIKNPHFEEEIRLRQKVIDEELLLSIMEFLSYLNPLSVSVKEIYIVSSERVDIRTYQGWEIYLDPQKSIDWQLTKLRAVLEESIPLGERDDLEYIDLRFGNLAPFKYKEE